MYILWRQPRTQSPDMHLKFSVGCSSSSNGCLTPTREVQYRPFRIMQSQLNETMYLALGHAISTNHLQEPEQSWWQWADISYCAKKEDDSFSKQFLLLISQRKQHHLKTHSCRDPFTLCSPQSFAVPRQRNILQERPESRIRSDIKSRS